MTDITKLASKLAIGEITEQYIEMKFGSAVLALVLAATVAEVGSNLISDVTDSLFGDWF